MYHFFYVLNKSIKIINMCEYHTSNTAYTVGILRWISMLEIYRCYCRAWIEKKFPYGECSAIFTIICRHYVIRAHGSRRPGFIRERGEIRENYVRHNFLNVYMYIIFNTLYEKRSIRGEGPGPDVRYVLPFGCAAERVWVFFFFNFLFWSFHTNRPF